MVTRQMQVERRTGKVRRPKTNVLPLCHATNYVTPPRLHVVTENSSFWATINTIRCGRGLFAISALLIDSLNVILSLCSVSYA